MEYYIFNFSIGHEDWEKDAVSMMLRCYFEDIIIMRWMGDNMLDFDVFYVWMMVLAWYDCVGEIIGSRWNILML